ncbi:MAG: nucleoside hydrolase [Bacteroidales bacterium]
MKNVLFLFLIFSLVVSPNAFAHKKASYNLIVDTDCGVDDFRMLQMLLASPEFNLNACITSDGVLGPDQGAGRIRGMLDHYGHQGVPVAAGKSIELEFSHRKVAKRFVWPGEISREYRNDAVELIHERLRAHSSKDIYLVSGSLTNLAALIRKYPEDLDEISRIVWYHNPAEPGMNYTRDTEAAEFVLSKVPHIDFVHAGDQNNLDNDFFSMLKTLNNPYASAIVDFYGDDLSITTENSIFRQCMDDYLPLFLCFPEYFEKKQKVYTPLETEELEMLMLGMLDTDKPVEGVIFKNLPVDRHWLRGDVARLADTLIKTHGYDEFQVVAMTNEFHGHLGIYSIMGAKMGLRAMQYFSVGLDELEVWSYGGNNPPLSCMHDGLQFSTGASLGYGSIHVPEDVDIMPKAVFAYKGQKVSIALREDLIEVFEKQIQSSIDAHGLLTEDYWDDIRRVALEFWLDLNKQDMFIISTPSE